MRRPGRAAGLLVCGLAVAAAGVASSSVASPRAVSSGTPAVAAHDADGRVALVDPRIEPPVQLPGDPRPPPRDTGPRPGPDPRPDAPYRMPRAEQRDPGPDAVPVPRARGGSRPVPIPEAELDPRVLAERSGPGARRGLSSPPLPGPPPGPGDLGSSLTDPRLP